MGFTDFLGDAKDFVMKLPGPSLLNNVMNPAQADLSSIKEVQKRAFDTQDRLGAERAGFGGQYNPGVERGFAGQQQGAIDQLAAAAAGRVPSPAELQLQKQSAINAARGFGMASAMGGRSPGGALRDALINQQQVQAGTNQDAGILRAQESAGARNALVQALQSARGQEQNLLGLDTDWRKSLLGGEMGALGAAGSAAGAGAQASAQQAASKNAMTGGLLQTGASLAMLSDEREKTDVRPANLNKLADAVKGFNFKYKDEANGPGERVGFMAQDAQKGGPIGRRMVKEGDDGRLRIDVGNAVGAALAMSAAALRRSRGAKDN